MLSAHRWWRWDVETQTERIAARPHSIQPAANAFEFARNRMERDTQINDFFGAIICAKTSAAAVINVARVMKLVRRNTEIRTGNHLTWYSHIPIHTQMHKHLRYYTHCQHTTTIILEFDSPTKLSEVLSAHPSIETGICSQEHTIVVAVRRPLCNNVLYDSLSRYASTFYTTMHTIWSAHKKHLSETLRPPAGVSSFQFGTQQHTSHILIFCIYLHVQYFMCIWGLSVCTPRASIECARCRCCRLHYRFCEENEISILNPSLWFILCTIYPWIPFASHEWGTERSHIYATRLPTTAASIWLYLYYIWSERSIKRPWEYDIRVCICIVRRMLMRPVHFAFAIL